MKNHTLIILALTFSFLCSSSCNAQRQSFLFKDSICELPCWQGIEIGMSNEQVKSILEDMQEIKPFTISEHDDSPRPLRYNIFILFDRETFNDASFYFADDQLKVMVFNAPIRQNRRLDYWIKELGEPDQVVAYGSFNTRYAIWQSYYYDNLPICLTGKLVKETGSTIVLNEEIQIASVVVSDPTFEKEMANVGCYTGYYQDQIQPWHGYDNYTICPNENAPCD